MYIKTDENNNVVEVIFVGVKPEQNGYEIENIDKDILENILEYKYIDGTFVKNNDFFQNRINEIKNIKINNLKNICQNSIINGIDYNGSHYSLSEHDQINLMMLKFNAILNPNETFLYHADDEEYREYTSTEIKQIAEAAEKWKTYHLTYFNMLKNYVKNMSNVSEVVATQYGTTLFAEQEDKLKEILTSNNGKMLNFTRKIINDNFDVNNIVSKIKI